MLPPFAFLLAVIGGSDMSLQYIFLIYVGIYLSEINELWIVRVHGIVYVAMTLVYSREVMQQSTH